MLSKHLLYKYMFVLTHYLVTSYIFCKIIPHTPQFTGMLSMVSCVIVFLYVFVSLRLVFCMAYFLIEIQVSAGTGGRHRLPGGRSWALRVWNRRGCLLVSTQDQICSSAEGAFWGGPLTPPPPANVDSQCWQAVGAPPLMTWLCSLRKYWRTFVLTGCSVQLKKKRFTRKPYENKGN